MPERRWDLNAGMSSPDGHENCKKRNLYVYKMFILMTYGGRVQGETKGVAVLISNAP
jgi:hypothetical protein